MAWRVPTYSASFFSNWATAGPAVDTQPASSVATTEAMSSARISAAHNAIRPVEEGASGSDCIRAHPVQARSLGDPLDGLPQAILEAVRGRPAEDGARQARVRAEALDLAQVGTHALLHLLDLEVDLHERADLFRQVADRDLATGAEVKRLPDGGVLHGGEAESVDSVEDEVQVARR